MSTTQDFTGWRRTLAYTASGAGGIVAPASPTQEILAEGEVAKFDAGANIPYVDGSPNGSILGTTFPNGIEQAKRIEITYWNLQARNADINAVRLKLMSVLDPTGTPVERVIQQWLILPNDAATNLVVFQDRLSLPHDQGIPLPCRREEEASVHFARPAKLILRLRNLADSANVNLNACFAAGSNGFLSLVIGGRWTSGTKSRHDTFSHT